MSADKKYKSFFNKFPDTDDRRLKNALHHLFRASILLKVAEGVEDIDSLHALRIVSRWFLNGAEYKLKEAGAPRDDLLWKECDRLWTELKVLREKINERSSSSQQ